MINVLQITDTHIFADPAGELYGVNTRESLAAVIQHYKNNAVACDLLIVTGDLSHDETEDSYGALESLLNPLNMPMYFLPGNHDVNEFMEEKLNNTTNGGILQTVRENWAFVLLDSSIGGEVEGRVSQKVLLNLENVLKQNSDKHVFVAVHHNPVKVGSAWMDRIGVQNREDLLDVLNKHSNVRGLMCGHIHQELETAVNTIAVYGTPSSCFQFTPHTPQAGIDDKPPGYRIFQLHDDGKIETKVYWVD